MNKNKALRKSFFASITRLLGVLFATAAAVLVPKEYFVNSYTFSVTCAIIAFGLMWLSEYMREGTE